VSSAQKKKLPGGHRGGTSFRHCTLPSLVGRGRGRGFRVSVLIIYFLYSYTKPCRAKYNNEFVARKVIRFFQTTEKFAEKKEEAFLKLKMNISR
jgi:hypothetical protein